jgi:hypothetical protein
VGQSETSDGLAPNQHQFAVLMVAFEGEDDWYGPRWKVERERRGEDHVTSPAHGTGRRRRLRMPDLGLNVCRELGGRRCLM